MESHRCDVCGKGFAREDDLAQHRKKHDQYQCSESPQAFATAAFLDKHRQYRHNQTGAGQKRKRDDDDKENTSPLPKRRITKKEDPRDHYTIKKTGKQKLRKFNTTTNPYRVNFRDLEVTNLPNILRNLRHLLSSIINDLTG